MIQTTEEGRIGAPRYPLSSAPVGLESVLIEHAANGKTSTWASETLIGPLNDGLRDSGKRGNRTQTAGGSYLRQSISLMRQPRRGPLVE